MTPKNTSVLELDILYEPSSSYGTAQNRFLKQSGTNDILYFCEVGPENKYTFHRGEKSGEVIATSKTCHCVAFNGDTDIAFTDPCKTNVCLEHEHYEFPVMRTVTRFAVDGVKCHWRGHDELVADDSKVVLASISRAWPAAQDAEHQVDRLVITADGRDMMDIVAVTALIVHKRGEEHYIKEKIAVERADELKLPVF